MNGIPNTNTKIKNQKIFPVDDIECIHLIKMVVIIFVDPMHIVILGFWCRFVNVEKTWNIEESIKYKTKVSVGISASFSCKWS